VIRYIHHVRAVALADTTGFAVGTLSVATADLAPLFSSPALAECRFTWASPGDSVRIVKLLDAVEPRAQGHLLRGAAVVAAGFLPRAQEAVADMSGPGAPLSPLGLTHNLVVEFTPADGADWVEVDRAVRAGVLAAAERLAEATVDVEPDEVEEWPDPEPGARGGDKPRVGAITNLQTQGSFKDVFVYGRSFGQSLPTYLDPAEVDAGAVASGQYGHPALKNPTIVHQNHPVVAELRRRHGQDLTFAGLVISPEPVESSQKDLVSLHAARLCAALGWDAAVVTKEGGGNADGDMALKMDALDDLGIASVGIYAEMTGPDGTGPPVVVPPNKSTAMISAGNYDERVTLPAVDKALGGETFALLDVPATDELTVPVAVVYAALSPLGWGRLTARPATEVEPEAVLSAQMGDEAAARAETSGDGDESDRRPQRVVHYINQFFAGLGGEDSADTPPASKSEAVGPGRKLASLLGDGFEIVATVYCGDDHAVGNPSVTGEVLDLVKEAQPDLLIAGPAFTSGRYGLACARLVAAAAAEGIPAVAAMHPDNPGVDEAGGATVVEAGEAARRMGPSLEKLAAAAKKIARGESLTADDGRIGKVPRRNVVAERNSAARAVDLVLARLAGDREATEIPLPRFDHVNPAPPVEDLASVTLALVTEGALVPEGNPDNLESARATKWLRYSFDDVDALEPGQFQSVHGGFSTQWANADPHRIHPLDVARELAEEGKVGGLLPTYLVTAGNGTSVGNAQRFGVEWAADLRHSGARAAILTST
jgi:glycine/betaine/sarcosine/D-proline reductase family selenoprotein B